MQQPVDGIETSPVQGETSMWSMPVMPEKVRDVHEKVRDVHANVSEKLTDYHGRAKSCCSCGDRGAIIWFGVIILLLMQSIPLMGADEVLSSTIYEYFVGSTVGWLIYGVCLAIIIFYAVSMFIFFTCARREERTVQVLFLIVHLTLLVYGIGFWFLSDMFSDSYGGAVDDLEDSCSSSNLTGALYDEFVDLLAIRETTSCSDLESVTLCSGYNASDYSHITLLEKIESYYRCSGYCLTYNESWKTLISLRSLKFSSRRGGIRRLAARQGLVALQLNATSCSNENKSSTVVSTTDSGTVVLPEGYDYPPTLFTLSNYKSSCTAMLIDDLTFNLASTSSFLWIEAVVTIVISIIVLLISILWMFCEDQAKEKDLLLGPTKRHHHRARKERH